MKAYSIALLFQGEGKTLLVAGTGIGPTPDGVVGALVARTVQDGVRIPFIASSVHEMAAEFFEVAKQIGPDIGEALGRRDAGERQLPR